MVDRHPVRHRVAAVRNRLSAVAGYVNPVTGHVHNAIRADTQTLIGAVCFLIGATLLLLPERTEEVSGQVMTPAAGPWHQPMTGPIPQALSA
jgi:hypothetical protein